MRHNLPLLVTLLVVAGLGACANTEKRPVGPAEVRVESAQGRVVAIDDVFVGGTHAAVIRTVRYEDGTQFQTVADPNGRQLGILRGGRAWRLTAMEGEVEVSASDNQKEAVAAILGRSSDGLTIRSETRIR